MPFENYPFSFKGTIFMKGNYKAHIWNRFPLQLLLTIIWTPGPEIELSALEYQFIDAGEDIHLPTHAACRPTVNFGSNQAEFITMGYFNENIYYFFF